MKYIDATLPLEDGLRGVEFSTAKSIAQDGWNAKTLHLYSHCGTHMDAPIHFNVNEKGIDTFPVQRFFSVCHIIDLNGIEANTTLTIDHLGKVGSILKPGEGLIFRTGWSKFVHEAKYRNGLPGLSKELALWCVKKAVSTIGVEPPSVADVNNLELLTEVHQILLGGDIIIIEGLCNLDSVKSSMVQMIALPLKIKDGDGAPCRVVLIED